MKVPPNYPPSAGQCQCQSSGRFAVGTGLHSDGQQYGQSGGERGRN